MLPDFKRLAVFRTVAASGGLTAAAAHLHKSPSAISYDLRQLERQLGTALLCKQGRGLVPTAHGRVLLGLIEKAYMDVEGAWQAFGQRTAGSPLRIACVSGFGRYRLAPQLLRVLPRQRRLELLLRTADEVEALLESGSVQYGISYRPHIVDGLASRIIASEELVMVGPKAARPPASAARIGTVGFATYVEFEYLFLRWFQTHGLTLPAIWQRRDHFDELEEALESVACGRGWSIVPADAARAPGYRRHLQIHRPQRRRCLNDIHLLAPPDHLDGEEADLLRRAAAGS